jgi:Mn-dependent DtxR family transcriptional regulator
MSTNNEHKTWRFLSNHTQVLLTIQRDPNARLRDIAEHVGITERAAQRIVADLIETGYVESERWAVATATRSTPTSPCATPLRTATRSATSCIFSS